QLVEEARVLDGDDGLLCKIADQLDLLVGEPPRLLTKDVDRADDFALLKQWNRNEGSVASQFNGGNAIRVALEIRANRRDTSDLDGLCRLSHTGSSCVRTWAIRSAPACFDECGRRIVKCDDAKRVFVAEI